MVSAKWVTGLNAPKGIRSLGGTLWVTDIDEVVSIDIARRALRPESRSMARSSSTISRPRLMGRSTRRTRTWRVSTRSRTGSRRSSWKGPIRSTCRTACWLMAPPGSGTIGARASGEPVRVAGGTAAERASLCLRSQDEAANSAYDGCRRRDRRYRAGWSRRSVDHRRDRCAVAARVPASGQTRVLAKFSGGGADFGYIGSKRNRDRSVPGREHRLGLRSDRFVEVSPRTPSSQ